MTIRWPGSNRAGTQSSANPIPILNWAAVARPAGEAGSMKYRVRTNSARLPPPISCRPVARASATLAVAASSLAVASAECLAPARPPETIIAANAGNNLPPARAGSSRQVSASTSTPRACLGSFARLTSAHTAS